MGVSLQCEMDRERLLKCVSLRFARFQPEKMKVAKALFGNQEFQWIVWLPVEESVNWNTSRRSMTDQNCCLRRFYIRPSFTFSQPGFQNQLQSPDGLFTSCWTCSHVSLSTSASQLHRSDIPKLVVFKCLAENRVKLGEFPVFFDSRQKDFPTKTEKKNIWLSHLLKWSLWKAFDDNWDFKVTNN